MKHPQRLPASTGSVMPEPPTEPYLCACGNQVEPELDASYRCDSDSGWHCADCHFAPEHPPGRVSG